MLRHAAALLLGAWAVYPLISLIQIFAFGGGWTTTMQIALCVTDVTMKIGFGSLIHRVVKLRTAEDARASDDVHPGSTSVSIIKQSNNQTVRQSDAGEAREVSLAEGSMIHRRRGRPPSAGAVAAAGSADDDLSGLDD